MTVGDLLTIILFVFYILMSIKGVYNVYDTENRHDGWFDTLCIVMAMLLLVVVAVFLIITICSFAYPILVSILNYKIY